MHGKCCSVRAGCCQSKDGRSFLTKEEKIDMLNEYKEHLENEAKGVSERIAEMQNDK